MIITDSNHFCVHHNLYHTCILHFHSQIYKNDDVILACPLPSGEYDLEAGLSHHNASLSHSVVTHLTFTKTKKTTASVIWMLHLDI